MVGIAYGLTKKEARLHSFPDFALDPNAILFFFLPLLIYASGRHINVGAMRTRSGAIFLYALPGVILTSFLIGYPVSWILDIPLLRGMLFGAAIGATDPIAVGAIFQRFGLNKELDMLVEGESLFNDGTTVVLFTLISALVLTNASFEFGGALGKFVYAVGLSVPIGLACGWIASKMLHA